MRHGGYGSGKRPGPQREDQTDTVLLDCRHPRHTTWKWLPRDMFSVDRTKHAYRGHRSIYCKLCTRREQKAHYERQKKNRVKPREQPVVGGMSIDKIREALGR